MALRIKNVLVLGAGGRVGTVFLPILLGSGLNVSVLSRPGSKATFPEHVNVIHANYEAAELPKAFNGQDAIIALVGGEALGQQKTIIDAAVVAKVKWFIPSDFGNDTSNPEVVKAVDMFAPKVAATKYLAEKEKDGLSWTSFINNAFFDFALQIGMLGFDFSQRTARLWDNGNAVFTTATMATVGEAVKNLLTSPENLEAAKNRHVYISSFATSQSEILAAIERVTGQKWTVTENVDSAKAEREAGPKAKEGDMTAGFVQVVATLLSEGNPRGDYSEKAKRDMELLLPGNKQTVEEEVRKVVEKLGK